MLGARLKTEEEYQIKFDGVAKDVVLDKDDPGSIRFGRISHRTLPLRTAPKAWTAQL